MEKGLKKAKDFKTVEELMEDLENWSIPLGDQVSLKKITNYVLSGA
jgi:hypothetical protein